MKKEIADQWAAALRSGKYKQGRSALKGPDGYCCLGVLCDISGLGKFEGTASVDRYVISPGESGDAYLPKPVREWSGVENNDGAFSENVYASLAHLNDAGMSFSEIADIIEERWEEL